MVIIYIITISFINFYANLSIIFVSITIFSYLAPLNHNENNRLSL